MSPSDAKSRLAGDTVTEVATGAADGVVGELASLPHPMSSSTAISVCSLNLRMILGIG